MAAFGTTGAFGATTTAPNATNRLRSAMQQGATPQRGGPQTMAATGTTAPPGARPPSALRANTAIPQGYTPPPPVRQAQAGAMQATGALSTAPNRAQLAADALKLARDRSQEGYTNDLRTVGAQAAALGRVGAGQTETRLADVFMRRERDLDMTARDVALNAAGAEMGDRLATAQQSTNLASYLSGDARADEGVRQAYTAMELSQDENARNRELSTNLQTQSLDFQGQESASDRALRAALQEQGLNFQGAENYQDRQQRDRLNTIQNLLATGLVSGNIDPALLARFGLGPPVPTPTPTPTPDPSPNPGNGGDGQPTPGGDGRSPINPPTTFPGTEGLNRLAPGGPRFNATAAPDPYAPTAPRPGQPPLGGVNTNTVYGVNAPGITPGATGVSTMNPQAITGTGNAPSAAAPINGNYAAPWAQRSRPMTLPGGVQTGYAPGQPGQPGQPGAPSGPPAGAGSPIPATGVPGATPGGLPASNGQPGMRPPVLGTNTQYGQGNLWTPPGAGQSQGPDASAAARLAALMAEYQISPEQPRQGEVIDAPGTYDPSLTGEAFDRQWALRQAGWVNVPGTGWMPPGQVTPQQYASMPRRVGGADGIVYEIRPDGSRVPVGV